MIKTIGLNIGYKSSILEVEDLYLEQGRVYFLIGKNGSGKSTFLKTVSGQISSITGQVFLNEKSVELIKYDELPKLISSVSSHFPQVEFLRVEEFIALGRTFFSSNIFKSQGNDRELIKSILLKLNISDLFGRFTSELSDGEKQMVAIAKALAQETPIILLDEPTAFLDYSNKTNILNNLLSISKEMNKCIVVSSHDIDMIVDKDCSYLAVNSEKNQLQMLENTSSKEYLLNFCF